MCCTSLPRFLFFVSDFLPFVIQWPKMDWTDHNRILYKKSKIGVRLRWNFNGRRLSQLVTFDVHLFIELQWTNGHQKYQMRVFEKSKNGFNVPVVNNWKIEIYWCETSTYFEFFRGYHLIILSSIQSLSINDRKDIKSIWWGCVHWQKTEWTYHNRIHSEK
jgi:hypothetical protein